MDNVSLKVCKKICTGKILSNAKTTGLRSMQHITGTEREIIEAYRNELTHDIWGNPEKLKEWVLNKFEELATHNYTSSILDDNTIIYRNNLVNEWAKILNSNPYCKDEPFLKLKILKSIVSNLLPNNKQLPPHINRKILDDTIYTVKKTGGAFTKTYFKLLRDFETSIPVQTENILEDSVQGKWYSIAVPNSANAKHSPGLLDRIKNFISVLSQESNWCIRSPRVVEQNYMNCKFDIFIDNKGYPQLCLVRENSENNFFKSITGNNQYKPIKKEYINVLRSFLTAHKLENALYKTSNNEKQPVINICV